MTLGSIDRNGYLSSNVWSGVTPGIIYTGDSVKAGGWKYRFEIPSKDLYGSTIDQAYIEAHRASGETIIYADPIMQYSHPTETSGNWIDLYNFEHVIETAQRYKYRSKILGSKEIKSCRRWADANCMGFDFHFT